MRSRRLRPEQGDVLALGPVGTPPPQCSNVWATQYTANAVSSSISSTRIWWRQSPSTSLPTSTTTTERTIDAAIAAYSFHGSPRRLLRLALRAMTTPTTKNIAPAAPP